MIWLKAIWNCLKRVINALFWSIIVTVVVVIIGVLVMAVIYTAVEGVRMLIGPEMCAAINNWFNAHFFWILGVLVLVMAAIPMWDGLVTEKRRLERKAMDDSNDG